MDQPYQREGAQTLAHYQEHSQVPYQHGLQNIFQTGMIVSRYYCACNGATAKAISDEHHLTKQAISPPFNFMHITHTEKTKLPALDTVDEKDLPGEFWSVSAYQRPRRHLHGIKAEDLRRKPREMSPISPISTNAHSRPISPIIEDVSDDRPFIPRTVENMSPLDGTMFDEISQTRFDPDDGALSLQPAKQVLKYPKRYSSLNALDVFAQAELPAENMNAFYESSSNAPEGPENRTTSPNTVNDQPNTTEPAPNNIETGLPNFPNFPLPPLPDRRPSQNQFKRSANTKPASNISLIIPVQQSLSLRSKRSSRSPQSALKSPTFSPHSERRNSLAFSDGTWEDDVDFCYEQAAESTCDFNWDLTNNSHHATSTSGSKPPSVSPSFHAYSPSISNDSGSSFPFNATNASNETIAERRRSRTGQAPSHHKRGSSVASVGHRGFLAARKSSSDLTAQTNANPAPLQISPTPAQVKVLSPVLSVTGADDELQKTPFTPEAFHYTRFDSVITESLSDPESYQNSSSSKHRKSSSYGSHESFARPPPDAARETHRWSIASVSSLPDLLHPRSKHKIFSKMVISSPLESLPQSPPIQPDGVQDSTIVPRELQTQPMRNSFVIRRQPSSKEAARRAAQRKGTSSETPQRMSRIIQTPDGIAVPEATKTGPQWI
jgi:hypothetical protein